MTRKILSMLVSLLVLVSISAQDASVLVESYQRNFARASLSTKYDLLKEAAQYENMGPLYDTALSFVLDNAPLLQTDILMRDIAILAVNMVGKYKYSSAAGTLMSLFKSYRETTVRVPVLLALATISEGNQSVLRELNSFLDTQNSLFSSGVPADNQVMDALLYTIGQVGDDSSFPVLFTAYTMNYSKTLSEKAIQAMSSLDGDFATYLANVIQNQPAASKLAALRVGLAMEALDTEQRGQLAETALSVSVNTQASSVVDQATMLELSTLAARELTTLEWQRASSSAVRHFYNLQTRFNRSQISKANFLESIALLGAMKTNEAAQALAIYLQLINTETEQGKSYDEQLTLAVINNLGRLADKSAFDHLLYVSYLQYPESIKRAAREALQKLNW
ncbi:MAG: hypothetical protein KKI09_07215 [Spirochaetes bacterium]|nr:hypothetical protein [Spirochaetota bacterium]MBU0955200.1 hypothetical protein [Spirochaetota bacterium]